MKSDKGPFPMSFHTYVLSSKNNRVSTTSMTFLITAPNIILYKGNRNWIKWWQVLLLSHPTGDQPKKGVYYSAGDYSDSVTCALYLLHRNKFRITLRIRTNYQSLSLYLYLQYLPTNTTWEIKNIESNRTKMVGKQNFVIKHTPLFFALLLILGILDFPFGFNSLIM